VKKSIAAMLILIFIIGVWIISRIWVFNQNDNALDPLSPQVTDSIDIPTPSPTPDPFEEERLLAEQQEAQRLEAIRIEEERIPRRNEILDQSRLLFEGYFYDEAISLLNSDDELLNHETMALEEEIQTAKNNLVLFSGDIKHISFRSLILFPDVLFPDPDSPGGDFNEGFIFQSEFLRLLPQLYENGYVLYNINDIFSKDENGVMVKNDIYLPPEKKPLIISLIDPSLQFDLRFPGDSSNETQSIVTGFANRVVFDEDNYLVTEVITPDGETIYTFDGDVHVALDAFVQENPGFSFRGHKGIIAVTGFSGLFGYDLPYLNNEETRSTIIKICDSFKENGWLFASFSYTHNRTGFWGPESTLNNIRWDTERWLSEIGPVVGLTNLFVAPFGFLLRGESLQVILENGFDIYFTNDFNQAVSMQSSHIVMGRFEIGGYALIRQSDILDRDFFDVDYVKDAQRPPITRR